MRGVENGGGRERERGVEMTEILPGLSNLCVLK